MIEITDIPSEILDKWQKLVTGLANFLRVDVAFITVFNQEHGELQLLRVSEKNQLKYEMGRIVELVGTFCEKTIKMKEPHQVHHAMSDEEWVDSRYSKNGINMYLGLPIFLPDGNVFGTFCIENRDPRQLNEEELEFMKNFGELIQIHLDLLWKNKELKASIEKIKILEKFLPICSECKKIRNNKGEWIQLETYISEKTDSKFTHGFCDQCADRILES